MLSNMSWSLAFHVSCPDNAGFCIVGTYAPSDPNPSQSWPAFTNELLRVPVNGGSTSRLAHHRSRPLNGYNYTPRASVSRDGTKLVYSSNFGLQDQLNLPTEYSDAYLMTLSGGSTSGGSTTPPPPTSTTTTVQESAGTVAYSGTWVNRSSTSLSGGTAKDSRVYGSKASFSFKGTGIKWIGSRNPYCGKARVFVDGVSRGTFDTYASSSVTKRVLFSLTGLAPGTHKIEVKVLHSKRTAAKDYWVWVDAFEVAP
jgi:hypothetical protein